MSVLHTRNLFIGVVATIAMDILSVTALKLKLIAFLPPRLTGRWFGLMAQGHFVHSDISQAPPISHEMAISVPMHYAVGIALAFVYVSVTPALGVSPRSLFAALGSLCAQIFSLGCSCFLRWATDGSGHTVRKERACSSAAS
jgi:hypothetical protein